MKWPILIWGGAAAFLYVIISDELQRREHLSPEDRYLESMGYESVRIGGHSYLRVSNGNMKTYGQLTHDENCECRKKGGEG